MINKSNYKIHDDLINGFESTYLDMLHEYNKLVDLI